MLNNRLNRIKKIQRVVLALDYSMVSTYTFKTIDEVSLAINNLKYNVYHIQPFFKKILIKIALRTKQNPLKVKKKFI